MFTSGPNRLPPRASGLWPDTSTGLQPASVRPKTICATLAARFVSGSNTNTLRELRHVAQERVVLRLYWSWAPTRRR
jgi:hypothetical protein